MTIRLVNRIGAIASFLVVAGIGSTGFAGQSPSAATPTAKAEPQTTHSADGTLSKKESNEAPPPSPEQIAAWIAQLDDDQYIVRERATGKLLAAGETALDPLLETANGTRPEPADRAVWILRKLGAGEDASLRRPALERLVALKHRPQVVAAANQELREIRHEEAAQAVKALGGRYLATQYPSPTGRIVDAKVVLDDAWRGADDGLKHLQDLEGVRQVMVIGTDVTAEGLAALKEVERLESLWLYGTTLSPQENAKLQELLPRVTIDYRQGGLLGVGGAPPGGPGPAVVHNVQPGTAAAAAGIRVHDIIQTFNGEAVQDFKDLTAKIAQHRAGDEVNLGLLRGSEKIDLRVKLGQWSAAQILQNIEPQ